MMKTLPLLFEIGCEEIPARFVEVAERQLGTNLEAALGQEARLLAAPSAAVVRSVSTPRRLAVYVSALLPRQTDMVTRALGPSVKVAFDGEGRPTAAARAFAAKHDVQLSALGRMAHGKGEYVYAEILRPGRDALQVLVELLPGLIGGLSFPKTMYWTGKSGPRFVRPIRWILALLGEGEEAQVIPFEFAGVKSGQCTYGHRLKGTQSLRVAGFNDYMKKLRDHGVEPDAAVRRERTRAGVKALLEASDGRVVADEWLEDWVVNSTEWPVPLLGDFENRYLNLPREVLVTVMRDHQKYFAVEDGEGKLRQDFIAVLNVEGDPGGLIRQGHERVLSARFNDAEFFWRADQKVLLKDRVALLAQVTYHERLGTYADKVRRMELLAERVCDQLELSGGLRASQRPHVLRAVELSKCDLTTEMVKEFTELQGIIGGLYARAQGEAPEVADAIYDHYHPLSVEDACPRSVVGAVVSVADKLDSAIAGFSAGLELTGSSDPFGLRRAGNGIIKLAIEALPGLDLTTLATGTAPGVPAGTVDDFLRERMEFYLREVAGLRYDTARAVLGPARQHLIPAATLSRARALERIRDTEDFLALAAAAKRTRNIRKSASLTEMVDARPDPALFAERQEGELHAAYEGLTEQIRRLSEDGDFEGAFRAMAGIRPQVDRFFEKVLVMTDDATVRRNRLLLLARLNEDVFTSLADLAEIAVEPRTQASAEP
jgi:glycyl-tRNA synthetase beta chain